MNDQKNEKTLNVGFATSARMEQPSTRRRQVVEV